MPSDPALLVSPFITTFHRVEPTATLAFTSLKLLLPWTRVRPPPVFWKDAGPQPGSVPLLGYEAKDVDNKLWWSLGRWLGPNAFDPDRGLALISVSYDPMSNLTITLHQGDRAGQDWGALPTPRGILPQDSPGIVATLGSYPLTVNLDLAQGEIRLILSFLVDGEAGVNEQFAKNVKGDLHKGMDLRISWKHSYMLRVRPTTHGRRPAPATDPIIATGRVAHTVALDPNVLLAARFDPHRRRTDILGIEPERPPVEPEPEAETVPDEAGVPIQEAIAFRVLVPADDPVFKGPDTSWKTLSGAPRADRIWYRQSERKGLFYYLPTSFRFGYDLARGLPTFQPYLYVRPDAGDQPTEQDYLVRLTLGAVPHIALEDLEHLRAAACNEAGLPYVDLELAPDVVGTFEVQIGAAGEGSSGGTAPSVDVEKGFAVQLEAPATRYGVIREQILGHGGGIMGNVFVHLDEDSDVSLPVSLSFTEIALEGVRQEILAAEANKGPQVVRLSNLTASHLSIADLRAYLVKRDTAPYWATPGTLGGGLALPITLEPQATLDVRVEAPQENLEWNSLAVSLGAVSVADATPEALAAGWLEGINNDPANGTALYAASVTALNLGGLSASHPGLYGIKVRLFPVAGAAGDGDSALLTPAQPEWRTKIVRTLAQLSAGGTGSVWYELEFYSVYNDHDGLPQRLRCEDRTSLLRALAFEPTGARYRLLDAGGAVLGEDLDRLTAMARIDELRAAGQTWTLGVVATSATGPTVPTVTVDPAALDFSGGLKSAYVTLLVGPEASPETATFLFSATIREAMTWTPTQHPAIPYRYQLTFLFEGGRVAQSSGVGSSAVLLPLMPPPA